MILPLCMKEKMMRAQPECMIDANERRDVATCDIVGACLMADIPDYVLLRLTKEYKIVEGTQ